MNDFTKEELEKCRDAIYSCMGNSSLWRKEENLSFLDKLQSLIDNYCEHKWQEDFTIDGTESCLKCAKRRVIE